jgi:hypothetical protein
MVIIRSYLRIFVIGIVSSRHARDVGKYCKRLEPVRLSVEIRSNTKFLRKIPDIYVSSNTIRGKVSIPHNSTLAHNTILVGGRSECDHDCLLESLILEECRIASQMLVN